MCGICLTGDTNRQVLINELFRNNLKNLEGLKMLAESSLGEKYIGTDSYEIIKRAITENSPELAIMMNNENRQKLFELALIKKICGTIEQNYRFTLNLIPLTQILTHT
jgi:hypothetical protein